MNIFTSDKIKEFIIHNKNLERKEATSSAENIPLFLKKLSEDKFSENELITILNNTPELSIQTFQGLHSLHYAILSNNNRLVRTVLRFAINNGFNEFPLTGITSDSKYENNQTILKFCYKQNKLNSFISLFEYGNFDPSSIKELALLSMVELNSDFNLFFRKIYGSKNMNQLNSDLFNQKKYSPFLINVLVESKGNIKYLKKFGYEFFQENENGTLLHHIFNEQTIYRLDVPLKKQVVSLDNQNKHYFISSLFIESVLHHKDLLINSKDKDGIPLYILLEKYLKNVSFNSNLQSSFEIKLQEITLEALAHKNKETEHIPKPLKF